MNNYINEILNIIDYAKILKSDIVFINGNIIYGTDLNISYLKKIEYPNNLNLYIVYQQKNINKFFKEVVKDINELQFINNQLVYNGDILSLYNYIIIDSIIRLNNILLELDISSHNIIYEENIRKFDDFEYGISLKSDQGIHLFKYNNEYILSIFKNLLPINKKDKVSMSISNIDENRFKAKFIINKPKTSPIEVDIVYLKIQ